MSRHGGDEFLILLSEVDHPEAAGLIAEKIVASIAEPYAIAGHELDLSASVGIALYPEDGQDTQTLVMRADTAMYHAKNDGRNRFVFYRRDMDAPEVRRSSIESELQERPRCRRVRAVLPADDRLSRPERFGAPRR